VGEPAVEGGGDCTNGVLEEEEAGVYCVIVEGGDAHYYVRMTVDIFSNRMHDDIRSMLQRRLHIRRHEGIIHDNLNPVAMRCFGHGTDIHKTQRRIRRGLNPNQSRLRSSQIRDIYLNATSEGDRNAVRSSDLSEVAVGAAIDV